MEMKVAAEKADLTLYEGEGGGYYLWSNEKTPLLDQSKVGAAKLYLRPRGLALPHYADSSKIGLVLQGRCTVGLVAPNSPKEQVVVIKKGDVIPLQMGVVSWWFNGGDTDVVIVFLGETAKALIPGQFTYFFVAGVLGILNGFQSDFVAKIFGLDQTESQNVSKGQPGTLIVKLLNGIDFPQPSKDIKEKLYITIDTPLADIVVNGGGIVNSVTEKDISVLGGMGLSARFVRLEGNAMLAPSYVTNGSIQVNYIAKGSGRIRVVGSKGKPELDNKVEEGEMFIIPQFYSVAEIADESGMEIFSIITSSNPIFGELAGNASVWKALSPIVLQSALNITLEFEDLLKSKNAKTITIVPPISTN